MRAPTTTGGASQSSKAAWATSEVMVWRSPHRPPASGAAQRECGIRTIRRWEEGITASPDSALVRDFCELTKVSADWLLGLSSRKGLR